LLGRLGRTAKAPRWLRRGIGSWATLFGIAFLDWILAASVFVAVILSTGAAADWQALVKMFFAGQVIGAISLIPGGLGSADAFWLIRLPVGSAAAGAALIAYRVIYYMIPWVLACLVLLGRGARARARWLKPVPSILALLIGGGGVV